jgi:hypothetical protein
MKPNDKKPEKVKSTDKIPPVVFPPKIRTKNKILTLIGITDHPEVEGGLAYFPTHSFDSIKRLRESLYETVLNSTISERTSMLITTDESDLKNLRLTWLNSELKEIAKLIENPSISLNGKTEVTKYKDYINKELKSQGYLEKSCYTVKSIIIAYIYMYKKGIYPIPEITQKGKKLLFYKKLEETYKLSFNSFKDDWADQEIPTNRFDCPENIRLAITLLGTFNDPKIKDAIQLAKQELKQAELKKQ